MKEIEIVTTLPEDEDDFFKYCPYCKEIIDVEDCFWVLAEIGYTAYCSQLHYEANVSNK